jgi:mannonate dehydratase
MSTRRLHLIATAGAAALGLAGLAGWQAWPEEGLLNPCAGPLPPELADHPLVRAAWAGLDISQVWDMHAHILGTGDGGGDLGFTRDHSLAHGVFARVQEFFVRDAACIASRNASSADDALLAHLLQLAQAMPTGHKLQLLALDAWHDGQGQRHTDRSHFWVGNDYCAKVAQRWPQHFEWAASVHPYRQDAAQAIALAAAQGARALKWIPSAQGIDPASPRCDSAYEALVRHRLPLITHGGQERAAPGEDHLGNPLRLRRALEHGVTVIVAHCASMGKDRDLDRAAGNPDDAPWVESFALFERLMDEPAHAGRLFGDLSAITQTARAGPPLRRVMERAREGGDWAGRLLNGSDYPLPAFMPLYSTRGLSESGLLDASAVPVLVALRRHNPLLYDFVLKRSLRLNGQPLAKAVFETRRVFAP